MIHRQRKTAWLALAAFALACKRERPMEVVHATPPPTAKPLDHLAPGELREGEGQVFGFKLAAGMKVRGAFLQVAYLEGDMSPEALANYVRERVEVSHVEIGAGKTVFPHARIKAGDPKRFFDLEVSPAQSGKSELVIRDVTPRPKNPAMTTDAQRWRQAGRSPDGKPLDDSELR